MKLVPQPGPNLHSARLIRRGKHTVSTRIRVTRLAVMLRRPRKRHGVLNAPQRCLHPCASASWLGSTTLASPRLSARVHSPHLPVAPCLLRRSLHFLDIHPSPDIRCSTSTNTLLQYDISRRLVISLSSAGHTALYGLNTLCRYVRGNAHRSPRWPGLESRHEAPRTTTIGRAQRRALSRRTRALTRPTPSLSTCRTGMTGPLRYVVVVARSADPEAALAPRAPVLARVEAATEPAVPCPRTEY
jgi:hypothetical protein